MILYYLTFLPAILILKSDDFELFNLPTCQPDTELRWFWTILPSYLPYPDTELRWFWTILPSYLPSWYWTQMILNYFTFLPIILILNSDGFELFYLPTCHSDTELKWFWTILPTYLPYPDTELRCFWTISPSYLPSWYWTQMILNYFTYLPAIQVLNSNDFEL